MVTAALENFEIILLFKVVPAPQLSWLRLLATLRKVVPYKSKCLRHSFTDGTGKWYWHLTAPSSYYGNQASSVIDSSLDFARLLLGVGKQLCSIVLDLLHDFSARVDVLRRDINVLFTALSINLWIKVQNACVHSTFIEKVLKRSRLPVNNT